MTLSKIITIIVIASIVSCQTHQKKKTDKKMEAVYQLSKSAQKVKDYVKKDIVIAHRGTTYWAPEETEAAFRWARNIGADYLELDLQLTKDNQLVAFHDDNLKRTTNIATVFPDRASEGIHSFTLQELRKLDAGSWFNATYPERARKGFKNLKILTLKDVINIAEGNRLVQTTSIFSYKKDLADNGNRPGLYIETKHPKSNIEKFLKEELTNLGWNINKKTKEFSIEKGKVAVANSKARVILQSFSPKSIQQLEEQLPNIPKCFLLWKPDMKGNLKETYKKAIHFAINNNVHIMGPSIAGKPNDYGELTSIDMVKQIHTTGLIIHPYTFDTNSQFNEYAKRVEGVFTNRADLALKFYQRKNLKKSSNLLTNLGYY